MEAALSGFEFENTSELPGRTFDYHGLILEPKPELGAIPGLLDFHRMIRLQIKTASGRLDSDLTLMPFQDAIRMEMEIDPAGSASRRHGVPDDQGALRKFDLPLMYRPSGKAPEPVVGALHPDGPGGCILGRGHIPGASPPSYAVRGPPFRLL